MEMHTYVDRDDMALLPSPPSANDQNNIQPPFQQGPASLNSANTNPAFYPATSSAAADPIGVAARSKIMLLVKEKKISLDEAVRRIKEIESQANVTNVDNLVRQLAPANLGDYQPPTNQVHTFINS